MIHPFVIEISREGAQLKIAFGQSNLTLRPYGELEISESKITELSNEVAELLNQANRSGFIEDGLLSELKKSGGRLYDELFTHEVKEKLRQSESSHLILYLDETLVQIPWELLFDGEDFFCSKYALGRWVRTKQKPLSVTPLPAQTSRLRMLILANPTGDLKQAGKEGAGIRDEMDRHRTKLHVDLFAGEIDLESVKKNIRDYDIVHFAGHADYDGSDPSASGWLFKDGKLSARDIAKLGSSLPTLVFSNACESAKTEEWKIKPDFEDKIYGLANAFLLAGTKHYIGTFWKVADEPSFFFAKEFYKQLIGGVSIGDAVQLSRKALLKDYGSGSIVWASYLLYGDPSAILFKNQAEGMPRAGGLWISRSTRYLLAAALLLTALIFVIFLSKGF